MIEFLTVISFFNFLVTAFEKIPNDVVTILMIVMMIVAIVCAIINLLAMRRL
jgi:hypothetical protein